MKVKSKNYLIIISIPIILGIITSLSLPPFNYIFLNFITLPLFFIFFLKNYEFNKIKSFIIGWSFGFGYFISNLYWLVNSLTFDENYKALIPFAFLLLPLFIGLFYGLLTLICCFIKLNNNFNSLLIFASIFSIIEFIRGIIFGGFPWNFLVFSLSNYIEFIQIVKIIGTDLLNLLVITIFLVPSIFFLKENLYIFCIYYYRLNELHIRSQRNKKFWLRWWKKIKFKNKNNFSKNWNWKIFIS